jgi:hypothetical protein
VRKPACSHTDNTCKATAAVAALHSYLHVCRDMAVGFADDVLITSAIEILEATHWGSLIPLYA